MTLMRVLAQRREELTRANWLGSPGEAGGAGLRPQPFLRYKTGTGSASGLVNAAGSLFNPLDTLDS